MLWNAFISLIELLLSGLDALLPDVPGWVGEGFGFVGNMWALLLTFSAWLPISFAVNVLVGVLVATFVSMVVQLTRMVVSLLTFGGGAT